MRWLDLLVKIISTIGNILLIIILAFIVALYKPIRKE